MSGPLKVTSAMICKNYIHHPPFYKYFFPDFLFHPWRSDLRELWLSVKTGVETFLPQIYFENKTFKMQQTSQPAHSVFGAAAVSTDPIILKEKPTLQRLSSSITPHCCIQPCIYTTTIPTSPVFPLSTLKPRFLRILKQQNPGLKVEELGTGSKNSLDSAGLCCCLGHLKQGRVFVNA